MKRNKKSIRGVSLLEVVVALTVVLIIASASISLLIAHTEAEHRAVSSYRATSYAGSTIDCFRAADDLDDFKASLTLLYGEDLTVDGNVYTVEHHGINIVITVSGSTLSYTATSERGKELYSTEYTGKI